jgi:putative peptide zinc metalloprotease protein
VTYDVAYSLVTVTGGAPVRSTNSAYALSNCQNCTTVAVSFQVVLVVGQSNIIAPVNQAQAINDNCSSCTTTAIADQIVVTLTSKPTRLLIAELDSDLRRLNALYALGASGSPAVIAADVAAVQRQIETQLNNSGLLAKPINTGGSNSTTTPGSSGSGQSGSGSSSSAASQTQTTSTASAPTSPTGSSSGAGTASATTTATTSQTISTSTTTSSAPASPAQTSTSASAPPG